LAISANLGDWNNRTFEAGRTPNAVTDGWYRIRFESEYSEPRFLAIIATHNSPDSAHLRASVSTTGANVRIEEDTTEDPETEHPSEQVNYLVVDGDGLLTALPR
jgi:hypothetical protein